VFDRWFQRLPDDVGLTILPSGKRLRITPRDTLLQSALAQGLAFPHNCRVGGCGECKCRLVEGKVKELTDKSYLLSAEELRDNYILACQSLPRSDLTIEVRLNPTALSHPLVSTRARIVRLEPLTHDILRVSLQLDQALAYTAGQYAEIRIPAAAGAQAGAPRSYSFAGAPGREGARSQVEFFIRKVAAGAFTEWLFKHASPGAELELQGPYGDFHLRPGPRPILCIAGGSGLAPIKAMLEQAQIERPEPRDLMLIFGARTQADLYAQAQLDALAGSWPGRFEVVPVLSAEPEDSDWSGARGLVPALLAQRTSGDLADHDVYLCGPPQMIDACLEVLSARGVPAAQIHFDKFLDSGHAAAALHGSAVAEAGSG
jgi:NAD(P)H-flavin reductase/ferredoxin